MMALLWCLNLKLGDDNLEQLNSLDLIKYKSNLGHRAGMIHFEISRCRKLPQLLSL